MPRADLRATRANRVFGTDKKRIRAENTVMVKSKNGAGFHTRSSIRADGFSSAQNRNSAATGGAV